MSRSTEGRITFSFRNPVLDVQRTRPDGWLGQCFEVPLNLNFQVYFPELVVIKINPEQFAFLVTAHQVVTTLHAFNGLFF